MRKMIHNHVITLVTIELYPKYTDINIPGSMESSCNTFEKSIFMPFLCLKVFGTNYHVKAVGLSPISNVTGDILLYATGRMI